MTIINSLIQTFNISEAEAGIFLSGFTKLELRKNDIFISRDRICKIGLIEKGLMKCVYEKEGLDIVFLSPLEPGAPEHPVATNKQEAISWNIKHTMWHCGQMAILKRVINSRIGFGLKR